jgi:hypothetical protein
LFRHESRKANNTNEKNVNIKYEMRGSDGIAIKLTARLKKNSILGYNKIDSDFKEDQIFMNFGILNEESKIIDIPFVFRKQDFTIRRKNTCMLIGCGNFDIQQFMKTNLNNYTVYFELLNPEEKNYNLLNILKILSMDDSIIMEGYHVPLLSTYTPLDQETEIKALEKYIKIITDILNNSVDIVIYIFKLLNRIKYLKILII